MSYENSSTYKISKYANWVRKTNGYIFSSLLTGELVNIRTDECGLERIQSIIDKKSELFDRDDELIRVLVENSVLVPDHKNESEIFIAKLGEAIYGNRELHLSIYPTTACNFRCKYCFESQDNAISMTEENKRGVLLFLKRNVKNYKSLYISWFGGEPLLSKSFLVEFMREIKQICIERKVPLVSNITTNGYNLDIDTFKELVKSNLLYYQITLDGPANIHNTLRPHVNNKDSYETIFQNLINIKNSGLRHFRMLIRVNISPELYDSLDGFFAVLSESFGDDSRFSFLWHGIEDWGGLNEESKELITQNQEGLIASVIARSQKYRLRTFRFLPKMSDVLCTACKNNAFIINADCTVSKCVLCTENVTEKDSTTQFYNKIGYIDDKGVMIFDSDKNAKWIVPNISETCMNCSSLPVCLGAICPHARKFASSPVGCTADKNFYRNLLADSERDAKKIFLGLNNE